MSRPLVALVTCRDLPDLDVDDQPLVPALADHGIEARPAVWDDPTVNWDVFDLCVLRSSWDYTSRRGEFVSWLRGVPRVANPAPVVEWNTDKRYLAGLAAAGVPTVPTLFVEPGDGWNPATSGEFVVKPSVGAGSRDTGRYDAADPEHRRLAVAHVQRLGTAGRTAMIQPYLAAVDTAGETGVVHIGGRTSHAFRKDALLDGPAGEIDGLYRQESTGPRTASPAEASLAEATLAAVSRVAPEHEPLLYSRVDMVAGADGRPVVLEVELAEPSLFLAHSPGAVGRFADAIVRRVTGPRAADTGKRTEPGSRPSRTA